MTKCPIFVDSVKKGPFAKFSIQNTFSFVTRLIKVILSVNLEERSAKVDTNVDLKEMGIKLKLSNFFRTSKNL